MDVKNENRSARKPLLNVAEVSAICGVAESTIWRGSKKGTFPAPVTVCGMKRWRRSEIEELVGAEVLTAEEAA